MLRSNSKPPSLEEVQSVIWQCQSKVLNVHQQRGKTPQISVVCCNNQLMCACVRACCLLHMCNRCKLLVLLHDNVEAAILQPGFCSLQNDSLIYWGVSFPDAGNQSQLTTHVEVGNQSWPWQMQSIQSQMPHMPCLRMNIQINCSQLVMFCSPYLSV